ncbi:MAG: aspartate/tyrosine/aromatic aminotransferase [Woeseiaceae bacterium]|nr:aspartate/tyrosine/aromatic aminotransferase [Woeseiaceae bacterium]
MFENLKAQPADAILRLISEYQNDTRPKKIDLGVGVYRNAKGETPILASVKKAEKMILEEQDTKTYLGSGGDPVFNELMQGLIFGAKNANHERIVTLHTPGGSGALCVAAALVMRARRDVTLWVPDPTWANHVPLLGGAGLTLKAYPYYDAKSKTVRFADMLQTLGSVAAGDLVLLHGCCHNPTGMDLDRRQWQQLATLISERRLVPFVDIAYLGLAEGLEQDAWPVRLLFDAVPEMIVAASCSKNFALYRDRIGSLSVIGRDRDARDILRSQAHNIVRTMYSMPPDHGAAIVRRILANAALRKEWEGEVDAMRDRLKAMRRLLVDALAVSAKGHDFSHIRRANGLFSFLGISEAQVDRLKRDYGVYMVGSSRINVAGVTADNVAYLAESIAAVL